MGGDKSLSQKQHNNQPRWQCFKGKECGASGAENLLPPSPCVTSSPLATSLPHIAPTLFGRLSVLRSFGWLLRRLSVPCRCASRPVAPPCHIIALCLITHHTSHLVVVESSCHRVSSHLIPPLSWHDVDALVAHLPRLDRIDRMAQCLLGDVYKCICVWFGDCKQMRKFLFGDVPQNSFKIREKIMTKNNKRSLVTCFKAIFPISNWWRAWLQMFLFSDCKQICKFPFGTCHRTVLKFGK